MLLKSIPAKPNLKDKTPDETLTNDATAHAYAKKTTSL